MTEEEVIRQFGEEFLDFAYYYKHTFTFRTSVSSCILEGFVTITNENNEFELISGDGIQVEDFKKVFTTFKVWKRNPETEKMEVVFYWGEKQKELSNE